MVLVKVMHRPETQIQNGRGLFYIPRGLGSSEFALDYVFSEYINEVEVVGAVLKIPSNG